MKSIKVPLIKTVNHSYRIDIMSEGIDAIAADIAENEFGAKYIIVTDDMTDKLYTKKLQKALTKNGINADCMVFKAGEKSKNWRNAGKMLSELVNLGADRNSCLLALGGGVVGDLTGFVASVYMRGIQYVQIPTTLLAMVDSSIGGKTGVDLPEGKNLAGSFLQPEKVYVSLEFLKTLPERQLTSGLAEVIKYGCIWDAGLFRKLEKHFKKQLKRERKAKKDKAIATVNPCELINEQNQTFLMDIIARSIEVKKTVIKKDEYEQNSVRTSLNYGHTVGHALELMSKFKLTHGEAISIGMHYEGCLSVNEGHMKAKELERQDALFSLVGLSLELPKNMKVEEVIDIMKRDKKSLNGSIRSTLLKRIGKCAPGYVHKVSEKAVKECLRVE